MPPKKRPEIDRFLDLVEKTDTCWLWIGSKKAAGYGNFAGCSKPTNAHRWSYEHFIGPIPEGLEIDHLCRVRNCVRPDHLEPVTHAENKRRERLARTHCKNGHEFTEANTYWTKTREGYDFRRCRACNNDAAKRQWLKRHNASSAGCQA